MKATRYNVNTREEKEGLVPLPRQNSLAGIHVGRCCSPDISLAGKIEHPLAPLLPLPSSSLSEMHTTGGFLFVEHFSRIGQALGFAALVIHARKMKSALPLYARKASHLPVISQD